MSTSILDSPRPTVAWRAVLVLLVTLLAHALLLERVSRVLEVADMALDEPAPVNARLLPPPVPEAPPPVPAPAPKPPPTPPPRPKPPPPPAVVEPPAPVIRETVVPIPAEAPAAPVESAARAPVEPPPAQAGPAAPVPGPAAPAEEPARAAPAEPERPIAAGGEMLFLALTDLPALHEPVPMHTRYVYRTTNSELKIVTATTVVDWQLEADGRYELRLTTSALGITILELLSQGRLRPFGLAPDRYVEARVRRGEESAHFDWDARRISFSGRQYLRPLADGTQDRVSFQIQLMLLGQAQPEWFRKDRQIIMWMAGRDDLLSYRFRSAGPEKTSTGVGVLDAVRLQRLVDPGEARIDVWLVPRLGWLPVRLRFTDRLGRVTESVLESIPKT